MAHCLDVTTASSDHPRTRLEAPRVTINIDDNEAEMAAPAEGIEGFNEVTRLMGLRDSKSTYLVPPKYEGTRF